MYPYKIKVFEPNIVKILEQLEQQRLVPILDKKTSKEITWKLKPIRPDIFLGPDTRYKQTYIGLKPFLKMETQKKGKGLEVTFSKTLKVKDLLKI